MVSEGEVLFVIDFAKNFSHVYQDEPQSAHWDRMQSTMHPVVSYYKCACGSTITDELMFFTADLKHDAQAVETFEKRTIEHLKERNVNLKCIYEFSDNCSGQYKSKNPFKILSESNIPLMRNFHCEKHRKCVADGTVGRTNQYVYCAIKTKGEVITNAHALAEFCRNQLEIDPPIGVCVHYQHHFFFIESIDRSSDVEATTLQDTRKVHSI